MWLSRVDRPHHKVRYARERSGTTTSRIVVFDTGYHYRIMSLGSSTAARPLALTEELEKLEQSITLTLQGPFFGGPCFLWGR
jgi:hypothetical protein